MTDNKRHPLLPDFLPSNVPGVLWPPIPGARQTAILALLFQMESSQWLPESALRTRQSAQLRDHLWHRRDFSATMAIIRQFTGPVNTAKPGRWGGGARSGPAWHLPISTDVGTQRRWSRHSAMPTDGHGGFVNRIYRSRPAGSSRSSYPGSPRQVKASDQSGIQGGNSSRISLMCVSPFLHLQGRPAARHLRRAGRRGRW